MSSVLDWAWTCYKINTINMISFFALLFCWFNFPHFSIFTCLFWSLLCFLLHSFFVFPCMLASGLLFLLWGAVPSVPAAWLHLLLWHLLIYGSGERQATGGWHRVAMAAHLQHIHNLDDRFVTRCPSVCPLLKIPQYICTCVSQSQLPLPFYLQCLTLVLTLPCPFFSS